MIHAIKKGLFFLGLLLCTVPLTGYASQAILHQIKAVELNYKTDFPSITLEDGSYWIFNDPGRYPNLETGPWQANDYVWIIPYENIGSLLGSIVNVNRGNATSGFLYAPGNSTSITSITKADTCFQVMLSNGLSFNNDPLYNAVCAGWNEGDFVTLCGDFDGYFAINTSTETYAKYSN